MGGRSFLQEGKGEGANSLGFDLGEVEDLEGCGQRRRAASLRCSWEPSSRRGENALKGKRNGRGETSPSFVSHFLCIPRRVKSLSGPSFNLLTMDHNNSFFLGLRQGL